MEDNNYFEEIGSYHIDCTASSESSKLWMNRAMAQLLGYNHAASIFCFKKVIEIDKKAPLAYWGLGYAYGPHYNRYELNEHDLKEVIHYTRLALEYCLTSNEIKDWEKDLIFALQARYPSFVPSQEVIRVYFTNFSRTMKTVYEKYPNNVDVAFVYAESVMNLRPWKLWRKDGSPTEEALIAREVIEKTFSITKVHPGMCHLYIHCMELSPFFKEADWAGHVLRTLVPASGHLLHMPSHLDVLNGRWKLAVETNERALISDLKYRKYCGEDDGFYNFYILHNYHFVMYAAMFMGDYNKAFENANAMFKVVNENEFNSLPHMYESFLSKYLHVYVRFGKWKEIMEEKLPDPKKYPLKVAMMHYAKGVAYASSEMVPEAEEEYEKFVKACKEVPENWMVVNNTAKDILNVALKVLVGEIEYRKKNFEVAFQNLREAAVLNDNLVYCEPWDWAMPPRHALGALLLEQNHYEEAYEVYLKDLEINPKNVWSLHGIIECMIKLNKKEGLEKFESDYVNAKKESSTEVKASCYCRLGQFKV